MRHLLIGFGLLALIAGFLMTTGVLRQMEAQAPHAFLIGTVLLAVGLATCDIVAAIRGERNRPRD